MKKAVRNIIALVSVLIVSLGGYIAFQRITVLPADTSWIADLGYHADELHLLFFNRPGTRSCPEIPVAIGGDEYRLVFDTGCGAGLSLTNVIEDRIEYILLDRVESRNRDGSHRGWSNRVVIEGLTVFGETFRTIQTSISDWTMYSSSKFIGQIGLAYFTGKVITLDYAGRRIAVSDEPIDYAALDPAVYTSLPLFRATSRGQQDLPFFTAEYLGEPVMVYLDTGKSYSYVNNPACGNRMSGRPEKFVDVRLRIGGIELMLEDMGEVCDLAQADGLPFPTAIELNSDQIWRSRLLVTLDLIEQKIVFRHMQRTLSYFPVPLYALR